LLSKFFYMKANASFWVASLFCLLGGSLLLSCQKTSIDPGGQGNDLDFGDIWVDPAFNDQFEGKHIVVWFEEQFLETPEAYFTQQSNFTSRTAMRAEVMTRLKELSQTSHSIAQATLDSLTHNNLISDLKKHWIINGFSCKLEAGAINGLVKVPGIDKIFMKTHSSPGSDPVLGRSMIEGTFSLFNTSNKPVSWNLKKFRIPDLWEDFQVSGEGTLNVVHDGGFYLDIPALSENLYRNPGEIPDNGVDDDGNGLIDDYHGFNFDDNSPVVNNPGINFEGHIHGTVVAGIISGRLASDTLIGIAPNAQWAPIRGLLHVESMIEWAAEQNAHTYTMSFSLAGLAEFRTHWRKLMEQGAYCGINFISGAGNFGDRQRPNYAPVPVQMRTPENIPAVFGVAGVDSLNVRWPFSSQGPVVWDTDYYQEGQVNKPDFSTYNFGLPFLDYRNGALNSPTAGNSFAGPHLAGIISLMLSANPELTPWAIRDLMIETSKDIGNTGFDFQSGYGMVNPYELMNRIK